MLSIRYDQRDLKLERMHELVERLGNPRAGDADRPHRRHQGQGLDRGHDRRHALGGRLSDRAVHFAPPGPARRADDGRRPAVLGRRDGRPGRPRAAGGGGDGSRAAGGSEQGPTYFEIVTALALLHFARRQVDVAVLEVGLGGRLDSTNICQPLVSVITSISFDHTRQLGNTLAAIAGEKAGIIKPGATVVSGVMADRAARGGCRRGRAARLPAAANWAAIFRTPITPPGRWMLAGDRPTIDFEYRVGRLRDWTIADLELALIGEHQGANAAVALAVLVELARSGFVVPEPAVRTGLATVEWPARLEILGRRPLVVVDAAHNVASIEALMATLDAEFCGPAAGAGLCDHMRQGRARHAARAGRPVRADRFSPAIRTIPRGLPAAELAALADELGQRGRGGRRSARCLGACPAGSAGPRA